MYLYIELWKAKQKWIELSQQERAEYMSKAGPYIKPIIETAGVEFFSLVNNIPDKAHKVDYSYGNVWKMPSKELISKLEAAVEQAGWHQYFEQVNAAGEVVTLEVQLDDAMSL
jgi:hypothetical protein